MQAKSIFRRFDESGFPQLAIRLIVGGSFLYMGFSKVADPITFLKNVRLFNLVPDEPAFLLNGIAIVLPWLEVVCGTALLVGWWMRGASAVVTVLLCVFTPAILWRALGIHFTQGTPFFQIAFDCGCGGGPSIIWIKLLENIGLLLLAIGGVLSQSRRLTLTWLLDRRKAHPIYCRRCGYVLRAAGRWHCENCRGMEPTALGATGTAVP